MPSHAVRADGLGLAYGSHPALLAATFEIPRGATTAVIGPNGSGKSSLLHAVAGLLRPAAGTLDVPAWTTASGVAYVLQATEVNGAMPITVQETVGMGRYALRGRWRPLRNDDRAAVDAALEALEITDLRHRQLHELSGGQRQRAFVAQGLSQDADLLLLDEPVTGLDLRSRDLILQAIEQLRTAGRTVVLSTHDLHEAAACDHVLLLANRLVASGPPAVVLTDTHLGSAYGGRLVRLDGGTLFLDDAAHDHDPEHRHEHPGHQQVRHEPD